MEIKHQKILVTGGTGFVGGHLVEALIKKGARVVVPYQTTDPHSYFFSQRLDKKTTLVPMDITQRHMLLDILARHEIDAIFHLAAQPIVTTAYVSPARTLEINVMGTVNMLDAARVWGKCSAIIMASSDKAYGKLSKKSYKETDQLAGDHPYEVSKSAADLIASSYYSTYGLPITITRFGNIYGEGDLNLSRIIPGIMDSLVHNQTLLLRSDGKHIRNYVYVKDVVEGYLLALSKIHKIKGEAFNLSSNEKLSVIEVIQLAEKTLGKKVKYKILNTQKNEIPYQSLDDSKARKVLGFRNNYSLATTVEPIFRWYKSIL